MQPINQFPVLNTASAAILLNAGFTHILPIEAVDGGDGYREDFVCFICRPEKGSTGTESIEILEASESDTCLYFLQQDTSM